MKEYIVTLKNFDDLTSFYDDMETPGGNQYIPNRIVDCTDRRPISKNTHYMLTEEEAEQITNDPRVLACEIIPSELGVEVKPLWTQTSSNFSKSSNNSSSDINWGLLRCVEGQQRINWGTDGTISQTGTISIPTEGRNVDIIIVDGHLVPNHPEFAKNSDGTGGTRVVQYNWYELNPTVTGGLAETYTYDTSLTTNNQNHGNHVAGIAAGNTQGWARQANIYNIDPYGANSMDNLKIFEYILAWHRNKPINPLTGRKNPTIVNNSWGYFYTVNINNIAGGTYRGADYTSPTAANLTSYGFLHNGTTAYPQARITGVDSDIATCIEEGIIFVGAAGNDSYKIDVPAGQDYNNRVLWNYSGTSYAYVYYHRGGSPVSATSCIVVGIGSGSVSETKLNFSSTGPGVDIYAPGENIQSVAASVIGSADPRNSSYAFGKQSGSSMSSPQVTGVLACALETYPFMTQTEARTYLFAYSKYSQMTDTGGSYTDLTSLQGGFNRYLYFNKERKDIGALWPRAIYRPRPSSGSVYPRPKIRR